MPPTPARLWRVRRSPRATSGLLLLMGLLAASSLQLAQADGLEIYQVPPLNPSDSAGMVLEWQAESGKTYELSEAEPVVDLRWQPVPRQWKGKGKRVVHFVTPDAASRLLRLSTVDPIENEEPSPSRFPANNERRENNPIPPSNSDPKPEIRSAAERVNLHWTDPAPGESVRYHVYRRIHRFESEAALSINISDGDFSDWASVRKATSYPLPPEDATHIQDVWVANDQTHLYVRIKHAIGLGAIFEPSIFIDVDRELQTGSGSKNWLGMPIGAELWYAHRSVPVEGGIHLTTKRRVWNDDWEGPFSADLFRRGNFADPFQAWRDDFELPFTEWSRHDDGTYQGRQLEQNSWEVKIPFSDLETLTGQVIDPRKFGVDLYFIAHFFDQFPTVGYGAKSPTKLEYGFKNLNAAPLQKTNFTDTPLGGLAYDYRVFATNEQGEERLVYELANHYVDRSHPADFNVSIVDPQSLRVDFVYPENPAISEVRILRRKDRFATHATDSEDWFEVTAEHGARVALLDRDLETGQPYFYTGFGMLPDGAASIEFWDAKDRSIPSYVKGPVSGLKPEDDYLVYFASWDAKRIEFAKKYDLVILHPGGGAPLITADEVAELKAGLDGVPGTSDDVSVIGYVSIGEDFGINRSQIEINTILGIHPNMMDYPAGGPWENPAYNWPRKSATNRTGPVHYDFETDEIISSAATDPVLQFPSYYTDMIDHHGTGGSGQDGLPDQNREWGGLYVNVGDPSWQTFIREATIERDFVAGIDHVLGDGPGQLDCDGIFLDTVGISTPWSIWFPSSVFGELYWIRDGTLDFMSRIGAWYPEKVVLPNRPMHLVFPELAGKRYDDFRALSSAIYWESYTPDLLFWWVDEHAEMFENRVIEAQSNHDNRGFTTMVLDYWAVMVDATEGGEFQQAPWHEQISEQIEAAESSGFLTHVTGSRSLADLTDYVYHAHHAKEAPLPDFYVHSIHGRELEGGQMEATIKIINQGRPAPSPFRVSPYINQTALGDEVINGLDQMEIYEFKRTFARQSIGNYVWVEIDPESQIDEIDEDPGFVERNNIKGKWIDRYLHPDEHWRPEGFEPDVEVTRIDVQPEFPVPGKPVDLTIFYHNNGSGVAPDSRMFVWEGRGAEGRQIGNEPTPFLMPGETKALSFSFVPEAPGVYSIGVNSDAVFAIIESAEANNVTSARFIVLNQDPDQRPYDWNQTSVIGPLADPSDDTIPAPGNILETSLSGDPSELHFRSRYPASVDFRRFQYVQFVDTDLNTATGYQISGIGADYIILDGAVSSYAGSGPDWQWTATGDQATIQVWDEGTTLDIHVSRNALGLAPEQRFRTFFLVTDGDNDSLDDTQGPYDYPPLNEGGFRLDGLFEDWAQDSPRPEIERIRNQADAVLDGMDATGFGPLPLAAHADLRTLLAGLSDSHLWVQSTFSGPIDFGAASYTLFLDTDTDATTGFTTSWGSVGAEYRIWNGSLYRYTGNDASWETQWDLQSGIPLSIGLAEQNRMEMAIPWSAIQWEGTAPLGLYFQTTDNRDPGDADGLLPNGDPAWTDDLTDSFPEPGGGSGLFPAAWTPDLVLSDVRVHPSDRTLVINMDAIITGVVSNEGRIASEPVDLAVWFDGRKIADVDVPELLPGGSWPFEISWRTPRRTFTYWMGVVIDSANRLGESDESNNQVGLAIDVWD